MCVCVSTWRQFAEWRSDAGASSDVVEPRRDPLRVRDGEQLCGRLAKLQDLREHGDPLVGVLDASRGNGKSVTRRFIEYL